MDPHPLRRALPTPLSARILEISDKLLLLRVHGDHGFVPVLLGADSPVDVSKLGVSVRMRRTLNALSVCLEAVAGFLEDVPHHAVADVVAHRLELIG